MKPLNSKFIVENEAIRLDVLRGVQDDFYYVSKGEDDDDVELNVLNIGVENGYLKLNTDVL